MLTIMRRLLDKRTNDTVGYVITCGNSYTVPVSVEKAKELGVEDIDIAHLMKMDSYEVISHNAKYALLNHSVDYNEDLATVPIDRDKLGVYMYGYLFKNEDIIPLDSEPAIQRMLTEML